MMTKMTMAFFLLSATLTISAQTVLRGKVKDKESNSPIAMASVGVESQGVGVMTSSSGIFTYKKYNEVLREKDSLIIKAQGYNTLTLDSESIRKVFNTSATFYLDKETNIASEIEGSLTGQLFWDVSQTMEERNLPEELDQIRIFLSKNKVESLKVTIFNDQIVDEKLITINNISTTMSDLEQYLKSFEYGGISNYDLINTVGSDFFILSSDGFGILGTPFLQTNSKAYVISSNSISQNETWIDSLIDYTRGERLSKSINPSFKGALQRIDVFKGRVLYKDQGLPDVVLSVANTFTENKTDKNGKFNIQANIGDKLIVSHPKMETKEIVLSSATKFDINMNLAKNLLEEVVLFGDKRETIIVGNKTFKGKDGFLNAEDEYITSEQIGANIEDIDDVLKSSFIALDYSFGSNGYNFTIDRLLPVWFVNNSPQPSKPYNIRPQDIESIVVHRNREKFKTNKYGAFLDGRPGIYITLKKEISLEDIKSRNNDYTEIVPEINYAPKATFLKGRVDGPTGPLQGVSIAKKSGFDEYLTNEDGSFSIPANIDDVVIFSYLGMFTKAVKVTSLIEPIEVLLISKNELLDEVKIEGRTKSESKKETLVTAYGEEVRDKIGYSTNNITSDEISPSAIFLADVVRGQFAGVNVIGFGQDAKFVLRSGSITLGGTNSSLGPVWVVDNVIYTETPNFVNPQDIEVLSILKSASATNRYGSIAIDGAFVITTKRNGVKGNDQLVNRFLQKGNDYEENLEVIKKNDQSAPYYVREVRSQSSLEDKINKYEELKESHLNNVEFFVDMAIFFSRQDKTTTKKVLKDLTYLGRNNTRVLKTVAYLYDYVDDSANAFLIYERILKLAPRSSQSYRDLAKSYVSIGAYNEALEMYINILGNQIKGVDFNGIENTVRRELRHLITRFKDKIEFDRLPNEWLDPFFKIDARLVLEWSEASVPFDFQFVDPNKKFFKWSHSLEENKDRLYLEKEQGFQMEEFIIDDASQGEWLVNVQFLGQESDYVLPPFLKYTLYRNYGTASETKEVRVIKLFRQTDKVTLAKLKI